MKKLSIALIMILFLTGCSLLGSNDDMSIDEIKTDISDIETETTRLSNEIETLGPEELLSKVDSIYARLTILEENLDGVTSDEIETLESEIEALETAINELELNVTTLETDTTLSDKVALLETLVNDLMSGNSLSDSEINHIITNFSSLTMDNLDFRYYENLNTESYVDPCPNFFYLGVSYEYCFETSTPVKYYDSSFSTVMYDIEDFKFDLSLLDDLFGKISNYDESPIIVGQNFEIETYNIGLLESNDTSLLFSVTDDELLDDFLVVIAKDKIKEILFIEAIIYQTISADNIRIRIELDYDYNLLEIQVEDGHPEIGGTMYYYSNYNEVQEFHHIKGDDTWLSIIQNSDYYVTTRVLNFNHSEEHIRVAIYNDDGLIMMLDDYSTPMFVVHHTSFSNIQKVALLYNNLSDEYLEYHDETILKRPLSIADAPTHMIPIPGQDHYLDDGVLTDQLVRTILFYNETINIDPIETEYNITFKFDKTALTSLLNTYVNNPAYALDLPLIEVEFGNIYYNGFLLEE